MTTFQDPPPQSRRAVRQSERGETPAETAAQPAPYSFDAATAAGAPAQAPAPVQQQQPPQTGRRAQQRATPPPEQQAAAAPPVDTGFEPLNYVTQARAAAPQLPGEQRVAPPQVDTYAAQSLANQPPPTLSEQPAFRQRDFSPEGRRSAINREQFQNVSQAPPPTASFPTPTPTPAPAAARPVDLDYHTQGVSPGAGSHSASPQPGMDDPLNHTLSRRELRELRAIAEEQTPQLRLPEPIDALLNSGPIDIPTLAPPPGQSQALADAMAEFDLLTRSRREAESRARDAQVASLNTAPPPVQQQPQPQQAVQQPPVMQAPQQPPVAQAPQYSAPQPPVQEMPPASQPTYPPQAVQQFPVAQQDFAASPPPAAAVEPVFIEPERAPTRRGHWSETMDDDELPFENTLSRTVGTGTSAITTSALVLPSVPQAGGIIGTRTSTGEILLTGSIDLPRSLGSTGAHPNRVDNSDFEDDPLDSQVSAPDSAPVRAIRAVSTHTSTRGVIESKRPQSNRMLTAVIIVASVLAVAVAGFLVVAFVTHQI